MKGCARETVHPQSPYTHEVTSHEVTSHEVTSHDVASKGTKHAEDAVEKNGRRPYGMGHEETLVFAN